MIVPEILNKPAGPGSLEPAADAEHRTIRGFHGGGSNATQVSSSADDGRHLRGERNCRTTSGKGIESGSDRNCGLVQGEDFEQEVNNGEDGHQVLEVRHEDEAFRICRPRDRSSVAGDSACCGFAEFSGSGPDRRPGCTEAGDEQEDDR